MSYFKHGEGAQGSVTTEYRAWTAMVARCTNPDHEMYPLYGARGITVCERWLDYRNFLADMGRRPSDRHSLERTRNHLGYSPENCTWALPVDQIRNRRNTVFIDFDGSRTTIGAALESIGLPASIVNVERVRSRLRRGWNPADAVRTSPQSKGFRYVSPSAS